MEAAVRSRIALGAWRLWALVPILLLVGIIALFASTGHLAARPGRPGSAAGRQVRRPPGGVPSGRDHDPGHEPAAPETHDRGRHGRRRDRPVPRRRAGDAHPAAFEHRRRPLPVGRRRPLHGRDHELARNPDDNRDRRCDRDTRPFAAQLRRLCPDRPARRGHPGGARARLAALAPACRRAVARRIHGADGRPAHVPRVRRARRGPRPPGHASRGLPGTGADPARRRRQLPGSDVRLSAPLEGRSARAWCAARGRSSGNADRSRDRRAQPR